MTTPITRRRVTPAELIIFDPGDYFAPPIYEGLSSEAPDRLIPGTYSVINRDDEHGTYELTIDNGGRATLYEDLAAQPDADLTRTVLTTRTEFTFAPTAELIEQATAERLRTSLLIADGGMLGTADNLAAVVTPIFMQHVQLPAAITNTELDDIARQTHNLTTLLIDQHNLTTTLLVDESGHYITTTEAGQITPTLLRSVSEGPNQAEAADLLATLIRQAANVLNQPDQAGHTIRRHIDAVNESWQPPTDGPATQHSTDTPDEPGVDPFTSNSTPRTAAEMFRNYSGLVSTTLFGQQPEGPLDNVTWGSETSDQGNQHFTLATIDEYIRLNESLLAATDPASVDPITADVAVIESITQTLTEFARTYYTPDVEAQVTALNQTYDRYDHDPDPEEPREQQAHNDRVNLSIVAATAALTNSLINIAAERKDTPMTNPAEGSHPAPTETQSRAEQSRQGVRVSVIGNLSTEPAVGYDKTGEPWIRLTVASGERVRDSAGKWQDKPKVYTEVALFGKAAERLIDHATPLSKGERVEITGRPVIDSYVDKDGTTVMQLKVTTNSVGRPNLERIAAAPAAERALSPQATIHHNAQETVATGVQRDDKELWLCQPHLAPE